MLDPTLRAFLQSWELDPTIALSVALAAGLYGLGLRRIWRTAGRDAVVPGWRVAAFYCGLLAVVLALQSPIAVFSGLLFSMHMTQHLLLTLVAAPLIVVGLPLLPMLWALPLPTRRGLGRAFAVGTPLHAVAGWLTSLLPALLIHTGTILAWHLPPFYDASLRSDAVHYVQHAMFFGTALQFWWAVVQPVPGRRAMSHGKALLAIIATTIAQEKLLGGLLTFASGPIYQGYIEAPRVWGISVLQDQQIAGLIMAVAGFMLLGLIFTIIFFAWSTHDAREAARREAPARPRVESVDLLHEAVGGQAERPMLGEAGPALVGGTNGRVPADGRRSESRRGPE